MKKESPHLSFEQWITYVFDHPVLAPGALNWYHDSNYDGEWWDTSNYPQTTLAYLTTLFEGAPGILTPFSDAQVKQGLWFLIDNSCSDHMFTLLNPAIPWIERKRCLSSMLTLFEDYFAPRCSAHLSHLDTLEADTGNINPLNMVCYMWWDLLPIYGKPEEPDRKEFDAACLKLMRLTLDLDSDACRENALHGLGHWALVYPVEARAIIDAWLARHQEVTGDLKAYALAARRGRVL